MRKRIYLLGCLAVLVATSILLVKSTPAEPSEAHREGRARVASASPEMGAPQIATAGEVSRSLGSDLGSRAVETFGLRGRVVDARGEGLEGVQVELLPRGLCPFTTSDARGRFSFVVPSYYRGAVEAFELRDPWTAYRSTPMGLRDRGHVVVASRRMQVRGRVLDSRGSPVPRALVQVAPGPGALMRLPPRLRACLVQRMWQGRTDRSGRYQISDVPCEPGLRCRVTAESFRPVASPLKEVVDFELAALDVAQVWGRVVDPYGLPIEGAELSLGRGRARSSADGSFHLSTSRMGAAGALIATCSEPWLAATCLQDMAGLLLGKGDVELEVVLGGRQQGMELRFLDTAGRALGGWQVELFFSAGVGGPRSGRALERGATCKQGTIAWNGAFEQGQWIVNLRSPEGHLQWETGPLRWQPSRSIQVPVGRPGRDLTIRLAEGAVGAKAELTEHCGELRTRRSATSDGSGTIAFEDIGEGPLDLRVTRPGYLPWEGRFESSWELPESIRLRRSQVVSVVVSGDLHGSATLRALDEDGRVLDCQLPDGTIGADYPLSHVRRFDLPTQLHCTQLAIWSEDRLLSTASVSADSSSARCELELAGLGVSTERGDE